MRTLHTRQEDVAQHLPAALLAAVLPGAVGVVVVIAASTSHAVDAAAPVATSAATVASSVAPTTAAARILISHIHHLLPPVALLVVHLSLVRAHYFLDAVSPYLSLGDVVILQKGDNGGTQSAGGGEVKRWIDYSRHGDMNENEGMSGRRMDAACVGSRRSELGLL